MNVKSIPSVVIVGIPNAGKSTLFNRLLGQRRAIIASESGTTRDLVHAECELGDRSVQLIDTAGLMKPNGEIEEAAQAKLEQALEQASVVLLVVDAGALVAPAERQLAVRLHKTKKPLVLVTAKADQRNAMDPDSFAALGIKEVVATSSIHNTGTEELIAAIEAKLPKSAASKTKTDPGIAVALVGKPNVGKSSLINQLSGQELAIVNEQAGTTRDTNQATITHAKQPITITDTAGIRRPGKVGKGVEYFSVNRAQGAIGRVDICVVLIDANEGLTAQDTHVMGQAKNAGKGIIVAVNKWDTLEDEEDKAQLLRRLKTKLQFIWWAPVVCVSAATGQNTDKLLDEVVNVYKRLGTKFKTPELNKLIQDATAKHPPAGKGNIHPKLNYVVQTSTHPVEITIFGANVEVIHFSYPRFLENQLREKFELTGVPVIIQFKSKYKEDK